MQRHKMRYWNLTTLVQVKKLVIKSQSWHNDNGQPFLRLPNFLRTRFKMRLLPQPLKWATLCFALTELTTLVTAHTSTYAKCQLPTRNPLSSCPKNTILVSSNDTRAHFTTIQSAILSLPNDNSPRTILILPGTYNEQVNITRAGPLTLLGQTANPSEQSKNTVVVSFSSANVNASYTDNAFTSVLTVAPTLEASLTGSGPTGYPVPNGTVYGNVDFRVYNIDFRNVFSETSVGPSLAVSVSRANAGFYYSGFYSYQDTVCLHSSRSKRRVD
jgi:pectin methylesterase-like acyl-CoA thioesterase